MSEELVRRGEGDYPVVLKRAAARQLARIQAAAILQRMQIDAEEQNAAFKAGRRIQNGYDLGKHLVRNAGELSYEVSRATQENPTLELVLRDVEIGIARTSGRLIESYMTRRLWP